MAVNGWPFVNFGTNLRNFNSVSRQGVETGVPMAIPRFKFTWLADLIPHDGVPSVTNLAPEGLQKGHLYTHLKSADHPKPSFKTETLNSYNRRYKLQTKMEIPSFSLTFHDDTTSFAMALVKECINYANWSGGIGLGSIGDLSKNVSRGLGEYTFDTSGTESFVRPDRSKTGSRPSLGMKIHDCARTWLSHIILYDLGTEPDSINVYVYHNPFLTNVEHSSLDNYDRTGFGEVTLTFECENYYFMIGQPHSQVRQFINQVLNVDAPIYRKSNDHAMEGSEFDQAMGHLAQCMAQCSDQGDQDFINRILSGVKPDAVNPEVTDPEAPADMNGKKYDPNFDYNKYNDPNYPPPYLSNPPKVDNPEQAAVFIEDRLARAEKNYIDNYGNLKEDTPQAAFRRQELENLRKMATDARAAANGTPGYISGSTESATKNTAEFGGTTPTPLQKTTNGFAYTGKNPAQTFADYNSEYMRKFVLKNTQR